MTKLVFETNKLYKKVTHSATRGRETWGSVFLYEVDGPRGDKTLFLLSFLFIIKGKTPNVYIHACFISSYLGRYIFSIISIQ